MRDKSSEKPKTQTREHSTLGFEECLNCFKEIEINDSYCRHCGQRNRRSLPKIADLLSEGIDEVFAVDGRLRQTLKLIFTKPGALTDAWLKGQRTRFVSPVKLYFLTSALFFFAFGNVSDSTQDEIIRLRDHQEVDESFTLVWETRSNGKVIDLADYIIKTKLGPIELADSLNLNYNEPLEKFAFNQLYRVNRYPELYKAQLVEKFSLFLILFIPVFALVDYLFFRKLGSNHFVGHIIHILNEFSIFFIVASFCITGVVLLDALNEYWKQANYLQYLMILPFLWTSIQSYRAYKRVYKRSGFLFSLQFFSLQIVVVLVIAVLFILYLLLSFILT